MRRGALQLSGGVRERSSLERKDELNRWEGFSENEIFGHSIFTWIKFTHFPHGSCQSVHVVFILEPSSGVTEASTGKYAQ